METEPQTADESLGAGADVGMGEGLRAPGRAVYEALVQPGMDLADIALCEEAGRQRDRLDQLQKIIAGDETTWAQIVKSTGETLTLRIDSAVSEARQSLTVFRQLIGSIKARWPDAYVSTDADVLDGLGEMAYADGPPGT
ncbi:hypothetical protein YH66_05225 [[Brevibacterium] flavum]|uniref:Uncharacterized protein n=1 Tax=[Brevibacterium] flavum TaxID=92706 RepID=A0A0F6SQY1_9CORY|nr:MULTISPECIES: hypothetical protein [Corynebacterium]AKF26999.1 hypothetical protein YH66_05225 [[Brevibacterium] flavum]ANE07821.1 hypothetical protein A3654_05215 [Corynebacterium glutamicum]AST20237.1 hypothetical protein CEY17_05280 [Corynebacterium glutamicum ATCC 14067]KEI22712.1 hypothetical protein KIQ_009065 [Corynebacterium glutamicum ATCC 14067]KIH74256.1 hypothetical protein SD36_05250 [Corynebacterium glutamicum]